MKYIIIMGLMLLALIPNIYAMPYDYHIPDPIETLDVFMPSTAQSWRELTVTVYICDGRFNPDCEYGHQRAMLQTEFMVDIYHINQETGERSLIESLESSTNNSGYNSLPVKLNDDYQPKEQYAVIISTSDRTTENTFWLFQKTY